MSMLTDPWAPRGRIVHKVIATTTTGITGTEVTTVVTGAAFTADPLRNYLIVMRLAWNASATGGSSEILNFNVRDGGGSNPVLGGSPSPILESFRVPTPATTDVMRQSFTFDVDSLTAGVHTLGVTAAVKNGTGTYTLGNATAGLNCIIDVFDEGLS